MRPTSCARLPKAKRISKAGSVRHTSTNFFVVWKTSGGTFPRILNSEPECMVLSSAAVVTAAEKVQARVRTRDWLWGMVETVAVSDVVYVITFLSPFGACPSFQFAYPPLAPWAAFYRRYAASQAPPRAGDFR